MTPDNQRHVIEQTFVAVRALATGEGGVLARLEEAADALLGLESREMPEALREDFADLLTLLLATADISAIAESDAADLALRILLFHEKLLLGGQRA